jgi:hypothetical protein
VLLFTGAKAECTSASDLCKYGQRHCLQNISMLTAAAASASAVVLLQVTALALGRLYVKLQADAALGQLLLPLLADVLCQGAAPSRSSAASAGLSSSSGAAGGIGAGSSAQGSSEDGVGGRRQQGLSAEVAGAVVCALEGMASTCVQQSSNTWLYEQALQLLLLMYREPTQVSATGADLGAVLFVFMMSDVYAGELVPFLFGGV